MTSDKTSNGDQDRASKPKGENKVAEQALERGGSTYSIPNLEETVETNEGPQSPNDSNKHHDNNGEICYNQILDDEIRSRLDKLNALSDLINSLETQFDDANGLFREILKCSTDRLSSIAKTLGTKSIRRGRIYHAAKFSVEQSQSSCQKACVQFEQANKDHQIAKKAIKDAELKLKEVVKEKEDVTEVIPDICIDVQKLNLDDSESKSTRSDLVKCDKNDQSFAPNAIDDGANALVGEAPSSIAPVLEQTSDAQETDNQRDACDENISPTTAIIKNSGILSEELNQAIMILKEAERRRSLSERQHLNQANKLMIAQENLIKLEREYGPSIRRSQLYFDEARRFNAKLSSVKSDICRISEDILAAKQAYAQTLSELEQFSDDLHDNPQTIATA